MESETGIDGSGAPEEQLKIFLEVLWIPNHPEVFQEHHYSNLLQGSVERPKFLWRLLHKTPWS